MKQTTNYKLNKPDPEDYYNINDQNSNMDVIDTELSGRAQKNHQHGAGDIASGTLPVERGGTGQASLSAARNAMGLGNTTGALPVANGGTGAATAAGARANLGITPGGIGAAAASHQHGAGDIASGTLPVSRGGTGQASLSAACNAMGLGNTTGALPVANGGTGATSLANVTVGNADKLDGKHAADFPQYVTGVTTLDDPSLFLSKKVTIANAKFTDAPDFSTDGQGTVITITYAGSMGNKLWADQILICPYVTSPGYRFLQRRFHVANVEQWTPLAGTSVSVQSAAPSSPKAGDLWVW